MGVQDDYNEAWEQGAKAARADEAERCALLAEELAGRWALGAQRIRIEGTYYVRSLWPPFKRVAVVAPKWEKAARDVESAAHGLTSVARGCREGWDTRKLA